MTEQCKLCVSRRYNCNGLYCSLEVDTYLKENEKCGSYDFGRQPIDDYEFEFDRHRVDCGINDEMFGSEVIEIDELIEKWIEGKI